MRILKSMEIQFLRILPKVQKNASQHHPNLCDIPCAMFFCDTPGSLSFSISSQPFTFANARTFRTVFDQKIGEKTEKDYVAAAKEIVKNVFLTVTTGCFSCRAVNQVRKLNE